MKYYRENRCMQYFSELFAKYLTLIHLLTSNNHFLHRDISDLFRGNLQGVLVENCEVGQFSYFYGAFDVFFKCLPDCIYRYRPQRFFRCQPEFRPQNLTTTGQALYCSKDSGYGKFLGAIPLLQVCVFELFPYRLNNV